MLNFIYMFLGKPLVANGVMLVFQTVLYFCIAKYVKVKHELWEIICLKLGLFLVLETFCQSIFSFNNSYIHSDIPLYIKMIVLGITSIPLFSLWISLPELLIKYSKHKEEETRPLTIISASNHQVETSEVTARILRSLQRIDKSSVVSQGL